MENKETKKKQAVDLLNEVFKLCTDIHTQCDNINKQIETMMSANGNTKASTPTMEEIVDYFEEKGLTISAERFFNYNEKRNWKVDGEPIKDWKALAESWQRTQQNKR